MSEPNDPNSNTSVLIQLGEVQGQLKLKTQMLQQNHESTHQRINDFRHAVEGRLQGVETRMTVIEANERATAIKSAGSGALAGAIMAAGVEALKYIGSR